MTRPSAHIPGPLHAALLALALLFAPLLAQTPPDAWKLTPAGTLIPVGTLPMSSVVTPDGKYLLVLNGGFAPPSISVIDLAASRELSRTPVPDAWLGLALTKAGDKLYVGGGARAAVFEFTFAAGVLTPGRTFPVVPESARTPQDFVGDVKLAPDGHLLYVADVHRDMVVVMNPQSGFILSRIRTGRRPWRILFHPSGKTMYVSSWADGSVGQYDVNSGERLDNLRVAPHPTDMVWLDGPLPEGAPSGEEGHGEVKARLFVSAANTNSLFLLGAGENGDLAKLGSVNLSLTPLQPLGMTPGALGLSADKKQVYVACADINALAVVDVSGPANVVKGYLPTGSYPTSVTALPDGRIAVLNGHGDSVQLLEKPDDDKLTAASNQVTANSPYRDEKLDPPDAPEGSPLRAGGPVKHVIYVLRSGGSAPGAPAPNRDRLARDYVSLANYQAAPNDAEGMNRATAAIAPAYTVLLAPATAAGRRKLYDYEGPEPANLPPAGYLWDSAVQAGISLRNYGFDVHNLDKPAADGEQVDKTWDPALAASTDMEYRGSDPAFSDTERAREFAAEIGEYGQLGQMPALLMVRIGSADEALGIIADAVTRSRFWNETALFVLDASAPPGGPKPAALVISPWAKPGAAAGTVYNEMSVLRTIEVLLGLRPMTILDAAATPLFGVFPGTPAAGH